MASGCDLSAAGSNVSRLLLRRNIRRDRTMKTGFMGASACRCLWQRYAIAAGHEVILTSRNPEKVAALVLENWERARR